MKGKLFIIFLLVFILIILPGCNKDKSKILSEKEIDVQDYNSEFECKKITYLSDGLEVVGYLIKPKNIDGKLPVIIFNRGGNRDFGKITDDGAIRLGNLFRNYVVLASQYRGNDGGEGKEEFGGSDLNDVLNLIEIAKDLPYANKEQIFMFGASRGGMMAYMACRESNDIKAAVIFSGVSDLIQSYNEREQGMKNVLIELIGGKPEEKEEEYKKRSAYYWAEEINVPLLILHGGVDWRVQVSQAEKMAEQLEKYNKEYKLVIYPGDDHGLSNNKKESMEEILEWFDKYKNN